VSTAVRMLGRGERAAAAAVWTALEAAGARGGVAGSWDWTETWVEHYGAVVPHRFAVVERDGTPVGAALVCGPVRHRRGPVPVRLLHVGTAGEPPGTGVHVEYNRLLAAPGEQHAVAGALLGALRGESGWDELELPGFAPEDAEPLAAAWPAIRWDARPSPVADLAAAGEDGVLGLLASGPRRRVRQSLRAYGELETELATGPEHALDILDELIRLHTERWEREGKPGAFASPAFTAFHRALVARWAAAGRALLFRARSADGTVGCLYLLREDDRALFYQSGLSAPADNRLRPGVVAHLLCMEACRAAGVREYDFLAPDSRYKRELATTTRELRWGVARRARLRHVIVDGARGGRALAGRLPGRRA
jgi:CelD/BcsL family acetyltransferase involved in cellulose biosynthesis